MNWTLFLAYVAIGSLGELLSIKHPTLSQRWAASIQVIAGGLIAAWLIPPAANHYVITGLLIARCGSISGRILSELITSLRILINDKREARRARAH